jgi:hypothetical protein
LPGEFADYGPARRQALRASNDAEALMGSASKAAISKAVARSVWVDSKIVTEKQTLLQAILIQYQELRNKKKP